MTDLLESTVEWGTLAYSASSVGGLHHADGRQDRHDPRTGRISGPSASPPTTPRPFGSVSTNPANSLGINQSGAVAAGPVWAKFMKDIHANKEPKKFARPDGLLNVNVTERAGLLPPPRIIQERSFRKSLSPARNRNDSTISTTSNSSGTSNRSNGSGTRSFPKTST